MGDTIVKKLYLVFILTTDSYVSMQYHLLYMKEKNIYENHNVLFNVI